MADVKLKLKPLPVPNFVYVEMPSSPRQVFAEGPKCAIHELDADVLEELIGDFGRAMRAKWALGRKEESDANA